MNNTITIRTALDEQEALDYFRFAKHGFNLPPDHPRDEKYYTEQFIKAPDLLLAAYSSGSLVGVLLGGLETDQFLVGEFYIDDKFRKQGIGTKMLRKLETNIQKHGVKHIYLGADPKAEIFYLKNNYIPELFVQLEGVDAEKNISKLILKFSQYKVIWKDVKPSTSKIIFKTNGIDKETQDNIRQLCPSVNTVYLFTKDL